MRQRAGVGPVRTIAAAIASRPSGKNLPASDQQQTTQGGSLARMALAVALVLALAAAASVQTVPMSRFSFSSIDYPLAADINVSLAREAPALPRSAKVP